MTQSPSSVADDQRLAVFSEIAGDFPDMAVAVREQPACPCNAMGGHGQGPGDLPMPDIDPNDDACIFYTSGTTGRPKGAQLTPAVVSTTS